MLSNIWNALLYHPLLNALAFLVSIIPGGDVGVAVIVLTILVKVILFPLSQKSIKNQVAMTMLAPELEKIKKSGTSKEEQAKLTFELYKKHKTNPFSGCLLVIPTIIVIIALYRVFIKGVDFDSQFFYPFIHAPEHINMVFLGIINISKKSFILAVLAAASQYFQVYFMPKPATLPPTSTTSPDSFQASFGKSMNMQMKYFFPVFIFVLLYTGIPGLIVPLSGTIALYWITSNIFAIGQQIYVNKTEKKVLDEEVKILISEK